MKKNFINELLLKKDDIQTDVFPWGKLDWYARKSLNGTDITLGFCHINPKMENAMHSHPNCDEVLYVVEGKITHRLNGVELPMSAGDSLLIPKGRYITHTIRAKKKLFFRLRSRPGREKL